MVIKFHFYKRQGLLPRLIRYFGGGEYNHVSVEVDGNVYEAIGGRLLRQNGVVMSPEKDRLHTGKYKPDHIDTLEVKTSAMPEVRSYLRSKVGSKYDYKDIFSYVFRWIQGNHNAFYCSELALRAYEIAVSKNIKLKYSPSYLYELISK